MAKFPASSNSNYENVDQIAQQQDLLWDGHYGSPYDIEAMIAPELRNPDELEKYTRLFDHTKRFKPRGSGAKKAVLAISSPYQTDNAELRELVDQFTKRFGLSARVNDERDRIYKVDGTIPILFWRHDLHELV